MLEQFCLSKLLYFLNSSSSEISGNCISLPFYHENDLKGSTPRTAYTALAMDSSFIKPLSNLARGRTAQSDLLADTAYTVEHLSS